MIFFKIGEFWMGKQGGKKKTEDYAMKKALSLILVSLLLCTLFAGCSKSALTPKDPVTLTMWHNYGGDMQATMDFLIDEFNSTVGKKEGIVINVEAIASSSELNRNLDLIVNDDPGAPDMPDIFTGYPKTAIQFQEKGLLTDLNTYFTEDELNKYVDSFVEEGRLPDGGLYVFPIAKSTEVLYVNMTLFNQFSDATGTTKDDLATFEGIAKLSRQYYEWCGKDFFAADSWFNFYEVGMSQKGGSIFSGEELSLAGDDFEYIFDTMYAPSVQGGIAVYNGYSSDLSKTGDIVCSTGSSAGILFYGDTITYKDGTVEQVEYEILPYPVFENGTKNALQRGGGLMVAKSGEKKEYAASVFIKWLTSAEQNMKFVDETGYLPVTKEAFEDDMAGHIETIEDPRVQMMLNSVMDMYDSYTFFTAPTYSTLDADSKNFEENLYTVLSKDKDAFASGTAFSAEDALSDLRK